VRPLIITANKAWESRGIADVSVPTVRSFKETTCGTCGGHLHAYTRNQGLNQGSPSAEVPRPCLHALPSMAVALRAWGAGTRLVDSLVEGRPTHSARQRPPGKAARPPGRTLLFLDPFWPCPLLCAPQGPPIQSLTCPTEAPLSSLEWHQGTTQQP